VRTLWRARRRTTAAPARAVTICRHRQSLLTRSPEAALAAAPAAPFPPATGLLQHAVWRARRAGDKRGHGKCSREESRPRAGDVAMGANPHGMRGPNAPHSKEAMTAMTRG